MNSLIEKTKLWSISLGSKGADEEVEKKKERLRSVLRQFRERSNDLTSRIAATFPQLTVHDVTHFDALWETADLVAGESYPLNPLEAFVLGGAILMHDAALCFEAYEGGQAAVRSTVAWKDALASEISAHPNEPLDTLEQYSDFAAIRLLHAEQAEKLGELEWKANTGTASFHLIEDPELRNKFGALIGQIAASHNWSIDDVKSRLPSQFNAPGSWPSEWRVDPVKIACLLRCADAAHLDDRRAPDFLLALIRRSGVSLTHWRAQNWLARVDVDQSDSSKTSLLVTSTHAFQASDADAWWVAYDAIGVLDAEIKASNNLLLSRAQKTEGSPAFKIQQVTGANAPAKLSKSVKTEGWVPTSAQIHVGNVQRLVETLGGQNLYGAGDNFAIVVRELLQNARDAIAARRSYRPGFTGKVVVRIRSKSSTQTFVEISDNGIGMSERTMTGALLDFGTSFWASDLVRSEFPGLRSSSFRPVGKFGIGFYSVFMVASEVLISSRLFNEGLSDVTQLHFATGLTLRPILKKGADDSYDDASSTAVRLTINEPIDSIATRWINKGQPQNEWQIPLLNYLAAITTGLDVPIDLQIENGSPASVHQNVASLVTSESISEWLNCITFVDIPFTKPSAVGTKQYISDNVERVRKVEQDGRIVGLAALLDTFGNNFQQLTTDTVGGLTNNVLRGSGTFMGYLERYPLTAKRDAAKAVATVDTLQSWANDQVTILKSKNATIVQLYWAASNMANMELDPIDVISFPLLVGGNQYALQTFEQIFQLLGTTPIACLKSRQTQFIETNFAAVIVNGLPTLRPLTNGNLIRAQIENGLPLFSQSLIGCLDRLVRRAGRELTYETIPTNMQSMIGPMDALIIKLKDA